MRNVISVVRKLMVAASLLGIAVLAFSATPAFGQSTSGDIVGTVKDASGALITTATVTITNETTGVSVTAKTNSAGEFRAGNLLPAAYDLTIAAPGFLTYKLKGFSVQLNATATTAVTLSIATSTSVEVEAFAGVTLDTTTNNLATTIGNEEISNLPITTVGFGALNASLLAPNVASPGGVGVGTGPSIGGQRPRNNNYTIEGIDVNDKSVTGPLITIPNDATAEFTLITNQFSPEFGHSSGGQFNTTVLSGTNHFHGRGYEYFQNRNLNAINAPQGQKVPNARYDFNRYGGQVGGPILRDKLFFFFNYERATTGQNEQYLLCSPTAAGLTTLSGLGTTYGLNATNLAQYLKYTPAANYLGGGQIDASADGACFNQGTGGQFITIYQGTAINNNPTYGSVTNAPGGGVFGSGASTNIPLGNYLVAAPVFANSDQTTASADYTISNRDSLRFRYTYLTQGSQDTAAYLPVFFQSLPLKLHVFTLSEFHNFTPNLTNEIRIGYNRSASTTPSGPFTYPGLDMFPNLQFNDQGGISYGPDGNAPQSGIQNLYQLTDNVTYVKGRHTFKLGFDGRKYISPQSFTQRVRGDYEWGYLSEFMHDLTPTYFGERSTGNFFYYGDQTALYGYANDTWRVTDKLTLNLGLRYEFTSVPVGERAQALNSAASVPGFITFGAPQPAGKNFAPRFGIAYSPNDKTSVRAGFGVAYDVLFDNLGLLSFPPQYSATNDVNTGTNKKYGDPAFLAGGGLPPGTGTLNTYPTLAAQRAATAAYLPNQVVPYAESYNLTIQHVIGKKMTAEIQYLGSRGIHLPTQIQLNIQAKVNAANQLQTFFSPTSLTPITNSAGTITGYSEATAANANTLSAITATSNILPQFLANNFTSKITSYQPYSSSNYNGLGLNLTRNLTNGLQFNMSYTYSRAMDNATTEVNANALSQRRPQDSQNLAADYSRSALDRPNRVTLEVLYDIPYFKHSNWLMKNLAGNWLVAPIYTYESPEYITVTSGTNSNLNGDAGGISRTIINPNVSSSVNHANNNGIGSGVFTVYSSTLSSKCTPPATTCAANTVGYVAKNPNAYYVVAGQGTLPNAERNTLPGLPINNFSMSATKRITFFDRYGIEFQAQAFNLFNHAQYVPGQIDQIGSTSTAGAGTGYLTAGNAAFNLPGKEWSAHARSLQLSGKFTF